MTVPSPLRLGLTGGIGSGKSTVAQMLAARGGAVIDSDAIARSVTAANGSAMPSIAEAFGKEFVTLDGALDRERMRALVFSTPAPSCALKQSSTRWSDWSHRRKRKRPFNRVTRSWSLMCPYWWSPPVGAS